MTDRTYTESDIKAAAAAAYEKAATLLAKQAEAYGCEHGQVDPTTGVWEASELEMQYCETLEQAATDIRALTSDYQTALAEHDAALLKELVGLVGTFGIFEKPLSLAILAFCKARGWRGKWPDQPNLTA